MLMVIFISRIFRFGRDDITVRQYLAVFRHHQSNLVFIDRRGVRDINLEYSGVDPVRTWSDRVDLARPDSRRYPGIFARPEKNCIPQRHPVSGARAAAVRSIDSTMPIFPGGMTVILAFSTSRIPRISSKYLASGPRLASRFRPFGPRLFLAVIYYRSSFSSGCRLHLPDHEDPVE